MRSRMSADTTFVGPALTKKRPCDELAGGPGACGAWRDEQKELGGNKPHHLLCQALANGGLSKKGGGMTSSKRTSKISGRKHGPLVHVRLLLEVPPADRAEVAT